MYAESYPAFFGIILAIVVSLFAGGIASIMNAPQEAYAQTVSYVRICGVGIICIVLFNALGGMFRGIGDSKTPLLLMGIACVTNIVCDLLLVGGLKMGAAGAAVATVTAADYLRPYSIDIVIVGFHFSMMGYSNGCGKTGFAALQGILSTFLVRIPVSYFMSKMPHVTLFQVGFATPMATVFAIVITAMYGNKSIVRRSVCSNGRRAARL